eukprot:7378774-Prymnesium_polylepis.1
MNNNSSRYGKFLMLQFDLSGKIMGATIKTYLLEKTRVVFQSVGERNYHVFHYFCDGAPVSLRTQLTLHGHDHVYLGKRASSTDSSTAQQFNGTQLAMRSIGFDEQEVRWVWTLLAVIIKLGSISFGALGEDASITEGSAVREIASLLGCDPQSLMDALTTRRIKAGSDWISSPNLAEIAGAVRDGMAKAMYARIFSWIVMRINMNLGGQQVFCKRFCCGLLRQSVSTSQGEQGMAVDGLARPRFFIGILDIFGFTNEKLQATFNQALRTPEASARTPPLPKNPPLLQAVFQAAMEENAEEDVHVEVADMSEIDNQEVLFLLIRVSLCHGGSPHEYARACQVLELIEGKPGGILSILNEECVVPKGSDASFADKIFQRNAGQFVSANCEITDPVSEDLMVLLKSSDEAAVRQFFAESADEAQMLLDRKKGAKFQEIFPQQACPVPCPPNAEKAPDVWADEMVTKQLRCSGVMEAVRVIAAGVRWSRIALVLPYTCETRCATKHACMIFSPHHEASATGLVRLSRWATGPQPNETERNRRVLSGSQFCECDRECMASDRRRHALCSSLASRMVIT